MKKILLVEDDINTQEMYRKVFEELFPSVSITQCTSMDEVHDALSSVAKAGSKFDLHILDGSIRGGHTCCILDQLPNNKIVIISGEPDYEKLALGKGIRFFYKPFLSSRLRENKNLFDEIMHR